MASFTSVNTPDRLIGSVPSSLLSMPGYGIMSLDVAPMHDTAIPASSSGPVRADFNSSVGTNASAFYNAASVQHTPRPVPTLSPTVSKTTSRRQAIDRRLDLCEVSVRTCDTQSQVRDNHLHQDHLSLHKIVDQHHAALNARIRSLENVSRDVGCECDSTNLNQLDKRITDLEAPYTSIPEPIEFRFRANSTAIERLCERLGSHLETCTRAVNDDGRLSDLNAAVSSMSERMNRFEELPLHAYIEEQLDKRDRKWHAYIDEQLGLRGRSWREYVDELGVRDRRLESRQDTLDDSLSTHIERSSRLESSMKTCFYEHVANTDAKLTERMNSLERDLSSITARTGELEKTPFKDSINGRLATIDMRYDAMCKSIAHAETRIAATAGLTDECCIKVGNQSCAIKDLKADQTAIGKVDRLRTRISNIEAVASPAMLDKKFNATTAQIDDMQAQVVGTLSDSITQLTDIKENWMNGQVNRLDELSSKVTDLRQGLTGLNAEMRVNVTQSEDLDKRIENRQPEKRFDKISSELACADKRMENQEREISDLKDSAEEIYNNSRRKAEQCYADGLKLTGRIDGQLPMFEEKLLRIRQHIKKLKTQQEEITRQHPPRGLADDIRRIYRRVVESDPSDEDMRELSELCRIISEHSHLRTPRPASHDFLTLVTGEEKEPVHERSPSEHPLTIAGLPETPTSEAVSLHDPGKLPTQMRTLIAEHETTPEEEIHVNHKPTLDSNKPRRSGRAHIWQRKHGDHKSRREVNASGRKRKRTS